MSTQDEWKATWDWAEGIWGEDPNREFNSFFRTVASLYAKDNDLEEVGSSDVWHISYWTVEDAKKKGFTTRRELMEQVLDGNYVWGFERELLLARYAEV